MDTTVLINVLLLLANLILVGISGLIMGIVFKIYSEYVKSRLHDDRMSDDE